MKSLQKKTATKLERLLQGDLEFHYEDSSYASHSLHAFAAKFPPQLPRTFIQYLTNPGDVVLDPMVGSGTTLVEALLLGRKAIGFDIDPLAIHICRVKTTPLSVDTIARSGEAVINTARGLCLNRQALCDVLASRFDQVTREFIDYWFRPETQYELMALLMTVEQEADPFVQDFLKLVFSSVIITKSGGVSLARDLAHSRPHRDLSKIPKNAIDQFAARLRKALEQIEELPIRGGHVKVYPGDARHLPLFDNSIDLIVTSPPYANAIDYMRAHKFSLVWLGESIEKLSVLRAEYIGSESCNGFPDTGLPPMADRVVETLRAKDPRKTKVLIKYFSEMKSVIREMHRVLDHGRPAIIVVGPSTMRGITVETQRYLADIAGECGFYTVGIAKRTLDRNRRMMPARFNKNSDSVIEQRMHEEYVIGLIKP